MVAHSPKDLGAVRVLNRSFVEALNRDIEVQPGNLQIRGIYGANATTNRGL